MISTPSQTGNMLHRLGKQISREGRSLVGMVRPRLWFWSSLARLLPEFTLPTVRARFYRWAGCDIGKGVAILGSLRLVGDGNIASRLHIAEGALIATGVTFGLDADIHIGRNVSVSPSATFYTATHGLGFGSRRMNPKVDPKPVKVEDGVWVGMQSLILPGVTLGQGCVVSAGSVVTQDIPTNTLAGGNPAAVTQNLAFGNR